MLRTVRHLIQLSHTSGQGLLSVGVVRAVVALAENSDDRLRLVCLETLAELGTSRLNEDLVILR